MPTFIEIKDVLTHTSIGADKLYDSCVKERADKSQQNLTTIKKWKDNLHEDPHKRLLVKQNYI